METITVERREHLVLLGLNRPEKRNAFNKQMLHELSVALTDYENDGDLWCALLFAHGDHFTAGLDLAEVGPAVAAGENLFPEAGVDPLNLFHKRTKPLVMAVQGWCLTIGIELLLAADIRVCAEGTRFRQMEVNRGIMPFGGATLRFPRIAGWGNAMRWLLTGDEFDAAEAHRMGLVQQVAAAGEAVAEATAIAERVSKMAPLAVQATMKNARAGVEVGHAHALTELMGDARGLMGSDDAREGVVSFMERREAVFKGR